jgi:hypothetical protein
MKGVSMIREEAILELEPQLPKRLLIALCEMRDW